VLCPWQCADFYNATPSRCNLMFYRLVGKWLKCRAKSKDTALGKNQCPAGRGSRNVGYKCD
jgi:hypothetical protein